MYSLNAGKYRKLEMFAKGTLSTGGSVTVRTKDGEEYRKSANNKNYHWLIFDLAMNTEYQIEVSDADVSYAYLSGNDDIMEEGVLMLDFGSELYCYDSESKMKEMFDTSFREQYHFIPFKNWLNDPNGLCWHKGYYHIYYQANPNEEKWGPMYWGHAVSKDLLHWKYLPFILAPQPEVLETEGMHGGAYSGSAVSKEDGLLLYFTRHIGPSEPGQEQREYQAVVKSYDTVTAGTEEPIVVGKPDTSIGSDFRDPKVFWEDGKWHMVIASSKDGKGAILCYTSDDMMSWYYEGVALLEEEESMQCFECPDIFPLDGKYVAQAVWMYSEQPNIKARPVKYYIGNYENCKFQVESKGNLDFGLNYYAAQTFEHEGRRIIIGWITDFFNEHIESKNGCCGSMSLPRELSVKDGKLYMLPVSEVDTLKGECLADVHGCGMEKMDIEGNSYYARIDLKGDTDFELILGECGEDRIGLRSKGGVTELFSTRIKDPKITMKSCVRKVRSMDIYVDRRTVEVFLNDGEDAGTKTFYNLSKTGSFRAWFADESQVEQMRIRKMKSVWY